MVLLAGKKGKTRFGFYLDFFNRLSDRLAQSESLFICVGNDIL
jgi:hypothetical protein